MEWATMFAMGLVSFAAASAALLITGRLRPKTARTIWLASMDVRDAALCVQDDVVFSLPLSQAQVCPRCGSKQWVSVSRMLSDLRLATKGRQSGAN